MQLVALDELHKMRKWKAWLEGVFDTEARPPALLVTGPARLEIFKRGGDPLSGRYLPHRLHPFTVRELRSEIARSLLKESKYYFYDTGAVADAGADAGAVLKNAVAGALLRELHLAEDLRGKRTAPHFLRDKERREVDFLTLVDGEPRHLLEVEVSDRDSSRSLAHFHRFLPGAEAVQVVLDLPRATSTPTMKMISAARFLSEVSYLWACPTP